MKTIHLEEILRDKVIEYIAPSFPFDDKEKIGKRANLFLALTEEKEAITNAMKEACKQTLELAAENAKISHENNYGEAISIECTIPFESYSKSYINKQSILDTIKQIEP